MAAGTSATELGQDHKLPVAGEWIETGRWVDVRAPYDGAVVGRVPLGDAATVDRAVAAARDALAKADFEQPERAAVLDRAARLLDRRVEDFASTIALEAGKPIKQARAEAQRAVSTLTFSAVVARKLGGEYVPMQAATAGVGKFGVLLRVPIGVVGAITPFNFPLNLVCHKLGPAIAAGDPIVQKPATQTPISSLKLAELLFEAGLPQNWLHVVCGGGGDVGDALVTHPDVAMITFTGSPPVGWGIRAKVPHKRVSLELGSTAPLVVDEDGDWQAAADKAKIHGFSHAGQSCISVQRILLHEKIAGDFLDRFVANVNGLVLGDPIDERTDVGPVIDEANRERILGWIEEARQAGAEILTGGKANQRGLIEPTVIKDPPDDQKVLCEEVFGPIVTVQTFKDFDEGLRIANDSEFGLQAGVFTRDIGKAIKAGQTLEFGGVLINEVPTFRTDQQPYGGVKNSGNTREGPAYAIREMTEERLVAIQG